MLPIARVTDVHACPKHGRNKIITGHRNATIDSLPIACVGDKTTCGAKIIKGSSVSSIDGRPVAYLGSLTSHGGVITTGSPTHKVQP